MSNVNAEELCSNCRFYIPHTDKQIATAKLKGSKAIGHCRRNPPSIYFDTTGAQPRKRSAFPEIWHSGQWCGEFKPLVQDVDIARIEALAEELKNG